MAGVGRAEPYNTAEEGPCSLSQRCAPSLDLIHIGHVHGGTDVDASMGFGDGASGGLGVGERQGEMEVEMEMEMEMEMEVVRMMGSVWHLRNDDEEYRERDQEMIKHNKPIEISMHQTTTTAF